MNILITIYRTDSRYDMMSRHPENIPGNKYRMIYGEFYSRYDIEHYTWCIFTRTAVVSYRYYTIPGIYNIPLAIYICIRMFVNFSYFWQLFSSYEHFSAKHQVLGHGKPGRTSWSRFRRDPCTLERVAGAQKFFSRREWIRRFS